MLQLELSKAFTLMESGPVVLLTIHDGKKTTSCLFLGPW